jgi:Deoxynucleotide monophosphate kinase
MIIGLTGLKGSGKDTIAAHLVKEYGYERRAFADPLKKSVANLFDIPFHEVDQMKNDETLKVQLIRAGNKPLHGTFPLPIRSLTFREFLQRYGTEAHRDVPEFGDDIWIDLTLPVKGYYEGRDIVVSDVRFENEARRIRYLKGVVVEVARPALVNQDPHRSETERPEPDYTIFNHHTIEELYTGVEVMFEYFTRVKVNG